MGDMHLFRTDAQPLTCYRDPTFERSRWSRTNPRQLAYCHKCRRRRWAAKLSIQIYYDCSYVFCTGGCPPKAKRKR